MSTQFRTALQKEAAEAVARSKAIDGMFRPDELVFLYELARHGGVTVEIGGYKGRSTSVLLQAAKVFGAGVVTIEPFVAVSRAIPAATRAEMEANLGKLELPLDKFELWEMTSDEAHTRWEGLHLDLDAPVEPERLRTITLLFIDGSHAEAQVYRDLVNWTPYVRDFGMVALHDVYQPSCPGVVKALARWWPGVRHQWRLLRQVDYTLAFRRRKLI